MQSDRKCLATPRNAKDYLAKNDIPQLFECLMTGLMYHRPPNHIDYLQDCLGKIKKQGVNSVRWDMFLAARHVPLPPISPICKEEFTSEGMVEGGELELTIPYDTAVVVLFAGPGMSKTDVSTHIQKYFPRFHRVRVGHLLRDRAITEINKGVSKWKVAASLINSGELAPDDLVIETIIREMNHKTDVSGYIIEGFPRIQKQVEDFEKFIGMNRLNFVLLVDSEEDTCGQALKERELLPGWSDHLPSGIGRRIANYKAYTLPVCKFFDDSHKLRLVDGDKTKEEVQKDILKFFRMELADFEEDSQSHSKITKEQEKYSEVPLPGKAPVTEVVELFGMAEEVLRLRELPQCPIVIILGGPGSGKSGIANELVNRYQDWVSINVNDVIRHRIFDKGVHTQNWDCLASLSKLNDVDKDMDQLVVEHWNINPLFIIEELKQLKNSTKGIILEGFPKDEVQLNQLNIEIGRVDLVFLLDCDEYYMTTRLLDRNERLHRPDDDLVNIKRRISYYKEQTLPICRYYDVKHRLNIIPGDRSFPDVFIDVINLMESAIMKNRCIDLTTIQGSREQAPS